MSLLATSLGSALKDRHVILLLDVARCHIHPTLLAHAKRCGIRLCYIPALMTAELQPCDACMFWRFKSALKEAWCRRKATSAAGVVSAAQWLEGAVLPVTDCESCGGAISLGQQTLRRAGVGTGSYSAGRLAIY